MGPMNGVAAPTAFDVLTLDEAAAYLRVPAEVVRTEAAAGRLVGKAVGPDWRFARGDLLAWLRTPGPVPAARPPAGVGRDFGDDPEEVIAAVYAERARNPVRG